ncbi:MAG: hypothetical protein KDI36_02830 [Pseudomonadales bacterium]|nr:hypothetical protein [Pseudomonadales bacterium]
MTDLLNTVDAELESIEEKILAEFDRIRDMVSDQPYEEIDLDFRRAVHMKLRSLHEQLELSGAGKELSLMSEHQEQLFQRIAVARQLLHTRIPTRILTVAHAEVESTRRTVEKKVLAEREAKQGKSVDKTSSPDGGLLGSIRSMFGRKANQATETRNRIQVTDEELQRHQPVEIYSDRGIYSASRELATVARLITRAKEARANQEAGRAKFEARDLSSTISPEVPIAPIRSRARPRETDLTALAEQEARTIAQSPEEIRRKLQEQQRTHSGRATFIGKDIEPVPEPADWHTPPPVSPAAPSAPKPVVGKATFVSRDIEPVVPPEAPRRRDTTPPPSVPPMPESRPVGKATFVSRDIKPIAEPEVRNPRQPAPVHKTAEETPQRPAGKAVFEARDLTRKD